MQRQIVFIPLRFLVSCWPPTHGKPTKIALQANPGEQRKPKPKPKPNPNQVDLDAYVRFLKLLVKRVTVKGKKKDTRRCHPQL